MDNQNLHKTPTSEQLQKELDAVVQEIDKDSSHDEYEVVQDDAAPVVEDNPKEEDNPKPENEEKGLQEEKEVDKKTIDYEKRYKDSSREIHIVKEDQQKFEDDIANAQNLPEPTEEQLKNAFPNYDDLDETVQLLAKDNLHRKMISNKIQEITEARKITQDKINARVKEVDVFSIHPDTLKKFPQLEGKQEEFISYASKPTRLTLDLEDLAKLFVIDLPKVEPKNGKMFETGSPGPSDKPKSNNGKLTLEQAETLKRHDYKKYVQALKDNKIDLSID